MNVDFEEEQIQAKEIPPISVDYYALLVEKRGAKDEYIVDSFEDLVLHHHPKRWFKRKDQDTEVFLQAYEAREVLTNPTTRKMYDYLLDMDLNGEVQKGVRLTAEQEKGYRKLVSAAMKEGRAIGELEAEMTWFWFRDRYSLLSLSRLGRAFSEGI